MFVCVCVVLVDGVRDCVLGGRLLGLGPPSTRRRLNGDRPSRHLGNEARPRATPAFRALRVRLVRRAGCRWREGWKGACAFCFKAERGRRWYGAQRLDSIVRAVDWGCLLWHFAGGGAIDRASNMGPWPEVGVVVVGNWASENRQTKGSEQQEEEKEEERAQAGDGRDTLWRVVPNAIRGEQKLVQKSLLAS